MTRPRFLAVPVLLLAIACTRSTQPFMDPAPPPPPSAQNVLVLTPASVALSDSAGAGVAQQATVAITNAGASTINGITLAPIVYQSTPGWLAATLTTSSTPATLSLSADDAGLAPGTYIAQVAVQANGASNSPQRAEVRFTVLGASGVSAPRGGMEGAIGGAKSLRPHQIEAANLTASREWQ